MEQVTAYKSVDGKVFATIKECQRHEKNLFPMFNSFGESCDDGCFVYIGSIKLKKMFSEEYRNEELPNVTGLWYYNSEESKWVSAEDYLSSFIKARDKIIRFINYNLTKET